jgi:transcriptional regulator with XRE-family HTH domain
MGTKLKIERIKKGWTQVEVSRRTHGIVPQHRISMMENGQQPKPDERAALAHAFGLPAEELFAE